MTNELVGALQDNGHVVDVVLAEWQKDMAGSPEIVRGPRGEDVLVVPPIVAPWAPTLLQRVIKWFATPLKTARAYRRHFAARAYDGVIAGTPTMLFQPVLERALATKAGRRPVAILFIHDFFPIHHGEIGLIPRRAAPILQRLEERAMSNFDIIYCNLPSNIDYLKKHYHLTGERIVSWTPLWTRTEPVVTGSREEVRQRNGLALDRPIAVFGGQIIEGRGIEDMLAAADLAAEKGSDLLFLFVGSGRLAPLVDARAEQPGSNVARIAQVPREDYLGVVSACDVGMVATVPGVSSHSFPTKTMDYLRVGIPVVVSVEPESSLASMVVEAGVGLSVPFGDVPAYLGELERAVRDEEFRRPVADAARTFLEDVLDVDHVPAMIVRDMARVSAGEERVITR